MRNPIDPSAYAGGVAARALGGAAVVARLEALARSQAPLRRALARIAGRIVAARSWERLGFARAGDYARERAGLSGRQLLDLAHVDGRLAELPAVEAGFLAGRLSWSKARLLARVARGDDEERWVAFARRVPVRVLEREVRALDLGSLEAGALASDEEGRPLAPTTGVIVRCTPDVQGKFHRARQVARRVAGERLPGWACMEAVAAEALSALGGAFGGDPDPGAAVDPPARDDGAAWQDRAPMARAAAAAEEAGGVAEVRVPESGPEGTRAAGVCTAECRRADASPADGYAAERRPAHAGAADVCTAERRRAGVQPGPPADVCAPEPTPTVRVLVAGLETADAFDLDARLRQAVALEQRLAAEMAPLLLRVADGRLHLRAGLASVGAFARERLGMSERKARALVRIARAAAGCPELGEAFAGGTLSWIQAQVLLPLLALPECAPFRVGWVARAARVSVRRLEDEVDAALARGDCSPERQTCARATGPDTPSTPTRGDAPGAETARFFFAAPRDVARLFRAVACSVRRALERRVARPVTEGEAVEWMFDHAFESWGANDPRIRREHRVFERDGWRCTVPGCSSYRNLHDHHVVFRSAGGSDALANRTTLCAFHHLRGVHAGRVRCSGVAPAGLRFELGLRPGRPPLLAFAAGELLQVAGA
jgi:hypothetical protein